MQDFIAIDFETANPKRVSACAVGYARVCDGKIVASKGHLIKPVGGHAPFQSKIHGIKEEHTFDKPDFKELYPEIKDLFDYPLVAHTLFDAQVLKALSAHFNLNLRFSYTDSSAFAKQQQLPNLQNCKLKTLVKYFELPAFKHHDATEDAIACAQIYLKLQEPCKRQSVQTKEDEVAIFKGLVMGILADGEVNYKETYELLYWLQDHKEVAAKFTAIGAKVKEVLEDDHLDEREALEMKTVLRDLLETF